MSKELLESICAEVDYRLTKDEDVGTDEILKKFNIQDTDPKKSIYETFVRGYTTLTEDYHDDRTSLDSAKDRYFNLGRVGWNSLLGALLGSLFDPHIYTAAAGALAGCGLTVYDEAKKKGMDLSSVAWGTFFGALIGSLVDPESSNVCSYVGAGIGASLGFTKEWFEAKRRGPTEDAQLDATIKKLDDKYSSQRNYLITSTVEPLSR